jgi:hypothetical protein
MRSPRHWVLVTRFTDATGYSENAAHHTAESGTGSDFVVFDDRQGGAA